MTVHVYTPGDRPDILARVDGTWWPGELRMWTQRDDGWWAQVNYRTGVGQTYIATVHETDVRPDTTEPRTV